MNFNSGIICSVSLPLINETISLMIDTKDNFKPSHQTIELLCSSIAIIRLFELGKLTIDDIVISSTDLAHAIMTIICKSDESSHYPLIDKVMPLCKPDQFCDTFGGTLEELFMITNSEYVFQSYLDHHCISKSELVRMMEVYPMSEKLVKIYHCLDPKFDDKSDIYQLMERQVQSCFQAMMLWNSYKLASVL